MRKFLLMLLCGDAWAGTIYTVRTDNNHLMAFDTNAQSFTDLGDLGFDFDFGDLAVDGSNGSLYIVGGRNDSYLRKVNLPSTSTTTIGYHGVSDLFAIAWNPDTSSLWGFSASTYQSYELDTSTGAPTTRSSIGFYAGGCFRHPNYGYLLCSYAGAGDWYSIDSATGASTYAFGTTGYLNNNGAAYDPDTGLVWTFDWSSEVHAYEPTTMTRVLSLGSGFAMDGAVLAISAVVYQDSGYNAASPALAALGIPYREFASDPVGFEAAAATADIIIVETPGSPWGSTVAGTVATALAAGKRVLVSHWNYEGDPDSLALFPALGIATGTTIDSFPSDLYSTGAPVDFFALLGGVLSGGQDLAGLDNTYFNLSGAGTIAATNAGGQGAIAVTNGGSTIVNGFLPWDWQYTDVNGNGKPDGQDVMEAEISYVLGYNPPTPSTDFQMTASGTCPGFVTFTVANGTPSGSFQAMMGRSTGSVRVPFGPCAGTQTGLGRGSHLKDLGQHALDGSGGFSRTVYLNSCGKYYQVMDLSTCETSALVYQ